MREHNALHLDCQNVTLKLILQMHAYISGHCYHSQSFYLPIEPYKFRVFFGSLAFLEGFSLKVTNLFFFFNL